MQVLEHEQHRRGGRVTGEERERLLEDPQLGTCGGVRGPWPAAERMPSNRAQGLGERLVGQLGADEIDRPAEQGPEARLAGAAGELGREPRLADARLAGHEDGRAAACPRGGERALELPELACAPHQRRCGASLHPASIARLPPAGKALVSIPWPADREPGGTR